MQLSAEAGRLLCQPVWGMNTWRWLSAWVDVVPIVSSNPLAWWRGLAATRCDETSKTYIADLCRVCHHHTRSMVKWPVTFRWSDRCLYIYATDLTGH